MTKRAERRHRRDVLKKRYKRLCADVFGRPNVPDQEASKRADHPDDCQHIWCKNPRHNHKGTDRLTMRERKYDDEEI